MHKILVVEDEKNVLSFIKRGFEEEGFSVSGASDGLTGWNMAKTHRYDLLVLDRMLPEMNGLEICRRMREKYGFEVPVIVLTALGSTDDIVTGLDAGADDYLTKPFHFKELLARTHALLRRRHQEQPTAVYRIADLELDDDTKTVTRDGRQISLTSKEYRLLHYLITNQRRVLSREQILEKVWDVEFDMGTNTVDVYINYLRNKMDKNFPAKLIHTVIGMGYVMKEE
ncbi:MAG: response regulator transcription factor [Rikenellaceae bacterium]|nr:response regulator transcription factor [Rikenellaceae bacterium]